MKRSEGTLLDTDEFIGYEVRAHVTRGGCLRLVRWDNEGGATGWTPDDPPSELRPAALEALRVHLNARAANRPGIPESPATPVAPADLLDARMWLRCVVTTSPGTVSNVIAEAKAWLMQQDAATPVAATAAPGGGSLRCRLASCKCGPEGSGACGCAPDGCGCCCRGCGGSLAWHGAEQGEGR